MHACYDPTYKTPEGGIADFLKRMQAWKGTPIEKGYNDAVTFINEAIASYVVGRSSDADWDKALATNKTMWADEFPRQATAAYKAAR